MQTWNERIAQLRREIHISHAQWIGITKLCWCDYRVRGAISWFVIPRRAERTLVRQESAREVGDARRQSAHRFPGAKSSTRPTYSLFHHRSKFRQKIVSERMTGWWCVCWVTAQLQCPCASGIGVLQEFWTTFFDAVLVCCVKIRCRPSLVDGVGWGFVGGVDGFRYVVPCHCLYLCTCLLCTSYYRPGLSGDSRASIDSVQRVHVDRKWFGKTGVTMWYTRKTEIWTRSQKFAPYRKRLMIYGLIL